MQSRRPSVLHDHLGYWLRMVSNAVSQGFARKLEAEGVTVAEWVVLRILYDEDRLGPSQLADRMGMTKGAVSKLADRLVDKRFIGREPSRDDKRAHQLVLLRAGRKLVPRLAALADNNDAEFFDSLGPAQRRQLESLLRKIAAAHTLIAAPTQ